MSGTGERVTPRWCLMLLYLWLFARTADRSHSLEYEHLYHSRPR